LEKEMQYLLGFSLFEWSKAPTWVLRTKFVGSITNNVF